MATTGSRRPGEAPGGEEDRCRGQDGREPRLPDSNPKIVNISFPHIGRWSLTIEGQDAVYEDLLDLRDGVAKSPSRRPGGVAGSDGPYPAVDPGHPGRVDRHGREGTVGKPVTDGHRRVQPEPFLGRGG
jgi:hypothetical protein